MAKKQKHKPKKQKDSMKPWSIRLKDKTIQGLKNVKDEKVREALDALARNSTGGMDIMEEYEDYESRISSCNADIKEVINGMSIKLFSQPLNIFDKGKKRDQARIKIMSILEGEEVTNEVSMVPLKMKYRKLTTKLAAMETARAEIVRQMEQELKKK